MATTTQSPIVTLTIRRATGDESSPISFLFSVYEIWDGDQAVPANSPEEAKKEAILLALNILDKIAAVARVEIVSLDGSLDAWDRPRRAARLAEYDRLDQENSDRVRTIYGSEVYFDGKQDD